MHFWTTDNNGSTRLRNRVGGEAFALMRDSEAHADLSYFAGKGLQSLLEENPSLLVFPQSLAASKSHLAEDDSNIITLHRGGDDPNEICVATGNLMGFVGRGDTELSIFSRFAQWNAAGEDFFLHYMLQKVLGIHVFTLEHATGRALHHDFLLFVFPTMLKRAMAQGLFKTYRKFERNDSKIKGPIDLARHVKLNPLFTGKVAYASRERTENNPLLHLIRHAIEFIKTKPFGNAIIRNNREISECVQLVYDSTPDYSLHDRQRVIARNKRPVSHPYYTAYRPLQKLCLMILLHNKLKYATEPKNVYGILFDGAWLWEEYLATLLTRAPLNFTHSENRTGENGICVYRGNPRYPDFYRGVQLPSVVLNENSKEAIAGHCILDAKYKRMGGGPGREDLHQMITYLHIFPAQKGAFIHPVEGGGDGVAFAEPKNLFGYGGTISKIAVPIPQGCTRAADFQGRMRVVEAECVKALEVSWRLKDER